MLNKMKSRLISGKRIIALIVIMAFATYAFATESDPSETVGFVKLPSAAGTYTPFGLPFTFYDATHTQTMTLDDIIGAQFTGAGAPFLSDQIIDINTGSYGWYNTGTSTWAGMTSFTANHANYAYVRSGHPAVDMYLAGQVDQSVINFGTMTAGTYNPVGIREAGEVNVSTLDLVSSGFTGATAPFLSDQLIDMNTGSYAWYNTGTSTWQGMSTITPGHAYYVYVRAGHTSFDWTYNPTGSKDSKSTGVIIKVKGNKKGNL